VLDHGPSGIDELGQYALDAGNFAIEAGVLFLKSAKSQVIPL